MAEEKVMEKVKQELTVQDYQNLSVLLLTGQFVVNMQQAQLIAGLIEKINAILADMPKPVELKKD